MLEKQQKLGIFESQKSKGFLKDHYCEFEVVEIPEEFPGRQKSEGFLSVAGELVFCTICGEIADGVMLE